jgi:hypothetical protein
MYGLDEETYKQPLRTRCDVHQGTTNLTFLKKMKNTDPLMGAKFSKTHLLLLYTLYFFLFLAQFLAPLASKFEKSINMT